MIKRSRGRVCALLCGAAFFYSSHAFAQDQQDTAVEELVITGSFIPRSEGFQAASPVDVLKSELLEQKAPTNLANFFAELPYNFGSAFSTGRAMGGGERGLGTVNLRGLGASATLVLLNGHRQTQVADSPDNIIDVNSLVPDIMVQRFEVLKDGASALYGSDAVAGVVNVITNSSFSGVRATGRVSYYDYSGEGDQQFQLMMGGPLGDRGHMVGAFAYVHQDGMWSTFDAPMLENDRDNLRYTIASGAPGRYVVPLRNAGGALILTGPAASRQRTAVDPSCGAVSGSVPTNVPPATAIATELPLATATDCRYFFFDDNSLQSELERWQGFVRGRYDFTDNLRFTGEFGFTQFDTATAYTTGETVGTTIIVPGHNPGNTFRAVNAANQPLYAVSSGVSAGYSKGGAAVFLPQRDVNGRVVLTATPTDPASGIAFWEDVTLNARLLGSQCGLPTNNALAPGECAKRRASESSNTVMQMSGYFSGKAFDWDWQAGGSYSAYKISTNGTTGNALTSELTRSLDGLGGPNCTIPQGGGAAPARGTTTCQYFNPFGNSTFATGAGNPQANTQGIIDWVIPRLTDQYESRLLELETHASGKLFSVPAGDVAAAVGYQFRKAELTADYDTARNNGATANLNTANDFNSSRENHAVFGEINAPIYDGPAGRFEINGALRHEWIGDELETTNPKVGLLFNTLENKLSLRASYGESFVAPSLFRLFGNVGAGTAVNDCAPAVNPVCTGVANLRITAITSGNPNLRPQTSENYNFGATYRPWEGWSFSVDSWHYTFDDLITTESATNVVAADPTGAITGRVVRNASGQLATVFTQYINAASLETAGIDLDVTWRGAFLDYGDLTLNLAGTYVGQYDLQQTVGGPIIVGAGRTNDTPGVTGLSASPKLRINGRATWASGPHTATGLVRYIDDMTFSRATAGERIESYTTFDASYTYNLKSDSPWAKDIAFTVGAQNLFDELAPFVPFPGFQPFISSLYDLRGRSFFARVAATY